MRGLLVGFVLFVLVIGVAPVQAAWSNGPITIGLAEHDLRDPVDVETWCGDCRGVDYTTGSPWTINPGWVEGYIPPIDTPASGTNIEGGCLWDVDDTYQYLTSGNVMEPGQSLSVDECIWQGPNFRRNGGQTNHVQWRSPSPDLVITHTWSWKMDDGTMASKSYTLPGPVSVTQGIYLYQACIRAPGVPHGDLIAVPGSHDGEAVWQVLTITATNPTSKKISKTGGLFGADPRDWGLYCQAGTVDPA